MEDLEVVKAAYTFGSEAYWALRAEGEQLPQDLMDKLITIADRLIRMEDAGNEQGSV